MTEFLYKPMCLRNIYSYAIMYLNMIQCILKIELVSKTGFIKNATLVCVCVMYNRVQEVMHLRPFYTKSESL